MKPVARIKCLLTLLSLVFYGMHSLRAQPKTTDTLIAGLMAKHPGMFTDVLNNKNGLSVQIIYTTIDRGKKGKLKFTDHSFRLNGEEYFYPASTVKLPVAILALQKLNELKVPGLNMHSTMITGAEGSRQTEVINDPSASDGRPTIAHYIKKILLVSDNDAFNRLYEFLGQEYINHSLHRMGYTDVQIIHRLEISLTEEENRHTNPVRFADSSGKTIWAKQGEKSQLPYANRNTRMGKGFMRGGQLVNEPFDFSKKNRLGLSSLHSIVRSILFPESVAKEKRFDLTADDYFFLRRYMSMLPQESRWPAYDTAASWDTYVKFLYYGVEKGAAQPHIRIFNKVGDAYGFLIDAAYIVDYTSNIEFLLSAVIHCNSDGIYNDDHYDYSTTGFPFMKNLGRVIYDYEKNRKRKVKPDLSVFLLNYKE